MGEIDYIPLKCLKTPSICVAGLFHSSECGKVMVFPWLLFVCKWPYIGFIGSGDKRTVIYSTLPGVK